MKYFRAAKIFARITIILYLVLFTAGGAGAQTPAQPAGGQQPWFNYSPDAVEPVIEYTLIHHMLAEQDPLPLLRIYGNGRVHAHFPVYMKMAGDYEYRLSHRELDSLLTALSRDGVIDFDPAAAHREKQQLLAQQRASGQWPISISDSTDTVIRIRLAGYQRNPQSVRVKNLHTRFVWTDLEQDARHFPQAAVIQGAAAGARRLRELLARPDLQRIP